MSTLARSFSIPGLGRAVEETVRGYGDFKKLVGRSVAFADGKGEVRFLHVQGSPDAYPASVLEIRVPMVDFGCGALDLSAQPVRLAAQDFIARALTSAMERVTRPLKGPALGGAGSFQPPELGQEILERNIVEFNGSEVSLWVRVSLPGTHQRAFVPKAVEMLSTELPAVLRSVAKALRTPAFSRHVDTVRDYFAIAEEMAARGLVAFVADGSRLARASGISDLPEEGSQVVQFVSPPSLRVALEINGRRICGMGIRRGVTLIVGGGYHGKSTLLNALVKGVVPHVPGDGREFVVTDPSAIKLRAEDGRSITQVDISGFIQRLPNGVDTRAFSSRLASGSTSQAAGLVEGVTAGASLLLIDEDDSATNFLIRDPFMRRLVQAEPIVPLVDRLQELTTRFGVSVILVAGGSSAYFEAADTVIEMRDYRPREVTEQARALGAPGPTAPEAPLTLRDDRVLSADNFDPSYKALRHGGEVPVRIKNVRLDRARVELGEDMIDLSHVATLFDPAQALAIGWGLWALRERGVLKKTPLRVVDAARLVARGFAEEGLRAFASSGRLYLARPRVMEVAAAMNRLRSLRVEAAEIRARH